MPEHVQLLIVSDIHYASDAEKERRNFEMRAIENPYVRLLIRFYRRCIWLRDPFAHNHLLDRFLAAADGADLAIANGDYSVDSGFIGVSDDAALSSASECLGKLRGTFAGRFAATIGDHELGKISLAGNQGGMRLQSYTRATADLRLEPFWRWDLGRYTLLGVTSSLIALPVYEPETLPDEREGWRLLRDGHLRELNRAFASIPSNQRILLFCHDPTALPFLCCEPEIMKRLPQIERTVVGHLHTKLVFWQSRILAGMPTIRFLGNSIRRMSAALSEARCWKDFRVMLCPSIAGIELLKDGGYFSAVLDTSATEPVQFKFHPLPR